MNAYAGTAQDYISRLSALLAALDRAQVDNAVSVIAEAWRAGRQVITLGSPVAGHPSATHATLVYEWLSGREAHDQDIIERVRVAPPVPFTSIFSRTDGIVAWPSSVQATSEMSENIAVSVASHLGLITNPAVLYIVANRLAQPDGHWRPHRPGRRLRLLHPPRTDERPT